MLLHLLRVTLAANVPLVVMGHYRTETPHLWRIAEREEVGFCGLVVDLRCCLFLDLPNHSWCRIEDSGPDCGEGEPYPKTLEII